MWTKGIDDYKTTLLEETEAAVEKKAKERIDQLEAAAVAIAEKLARIGNSEKE